MSDGLTPNGGLTSSITLLLPMRQAMASLPNPTSMLFAPPAPPYRLQENQSVVIGRSRDCELPIAAPEASRRHCEITHEGDQFLVKDLDSTNGTFVNGEPLLAPRTLRPGDRIEIGNFAITFCQVAGTSALPETTEGGKTMIFQRGTAHEATVEVLQGDLSEVPPFAVLQILEMGSKTGALRISAGKFTGCIWLEKGAPVHANTEKHAGFEAAAQLVILEQGRFTFEPNAASPEKTISASMTELLLEAMRMADESALL